MGLLGTKIKPLTEGQKKLIKALKDKKTEVLGIFGPTGTGKSLLTVAYAFDSIQNKEYTRFIIAKPLVDVESGREAGLQSPREIYRENVANYIIDLLGTYVDKENIIKMIEEDLIHIADIHYLRGRTFDNSLVFVDDVQNVPVESTLEIISRIGRKSKLIIAGDPIFQLSAETRRQAMDIRELLLGEEKAEIIDLGLTDIIRPGARKAVKLLLELRLRRRKLNETEKELYQKTKEIAPDAEIVTILDCREEKKKYQLENTTSPDILILVKENHHGRVVGKKGERISNLEKETNMKIRVAEVSLDMLYLVKAIHPIPWAFKNVSKADIEGNKIVITVEGGAGKILGQKGLYIKFVDSIAKKLFGAQVIVREEEAK